MIQTYFGVPPTNEIPTAVQHNTPVYRRVRVVTYPHVHGKRVRHVRWVKKQTGVKVTFTNDGPPVTIDNPTFTSLVADAGVIYASEPPPYSTGTCS